MSSPSRSNCTCAAVEAAGREGRGARRAAGGWGRRAGWAGIRVSASALSTLRQSAHAQQRGSERARRATWHGDGSGKEIRARNEQAAGSEGGRPRHLAHGVAVALRPRERLDEVRHEAGDGARQEALLGGRSGLHPLVDAAAQPEAIPDRRGASQGASGGATGDVTRGRHALHGAGAGKSKAAASCEAARQRGLKARGKRETAYARSGQAQARTASRAAARSAGARCEPAAQAPSPAAPQRPPPPRRRGRCAPARHRRPRAARCPVRTVRTVRCSRPEPPRRRRPARPPRAARGAPCTCGGGGWRQRWGLIAAGGEAVTVTVTGVTEGGKAA